MRQPLSLLLWLMELGAGLIAAMLLALWLWSASEGSLAAALGWAGRYLSAGQSIQVQDARGSLRDGGRIALLRWENRGLVVQARDLDFAWQPLGLLQGRLEFGHIRAAELVIEDRRPASGQPLTELMLPLAVDAAFAVESLRASGGWSLDARSLAGRYRFDGSRHRLEMDRLQLAAGRYQLQASLQARAALLLDIQLQGQLQTELAGAPLLLDASGSLSGPLAGTDPSLSLAARIQPASRGAAPADSGAVGAAISAHIRPWAQQPVLQAQASFSAIDLALLWPALPKTLLSGSARLEPHADGWQAQVELNNRAAGPWDSVRLPIDSARAVLRYANAQWTVDSLAATGAGGRMRMQGTLAQQGLGALSGWQGRVQLESVNPALVHSQLARANLDGELRLGAAQQGLDFEAAVRPAAAQATGATAGGPADVAAAAGRLDAGIRGLRLQSASAKGRWSDGVLDFASVRVSSDDAQLQGHLQWRVATGSARGALQLRVPGAQAELEGAFGARDGDGSVSLKVEQAERALRWLAALPPMGQGALAGVSAQGAAELSLRWQGGWEALLGEPGLDAALQLRMRAQQLTLGKSGGTQGLGLHGVDISAAGPVGALAIKGGGELQWQGMRLALQVQGLGARAPAAAEATGWTLTIDQLRAQLEDRLHAAPWTLALRQPLKLDWQSGSVSLMRAGAGEAALSGPLAGVATLSWQPLLWRQGARGELHSQGALSGLPMHWLDLLGGTQFSEVGLSGNMLFDATWDIAVAQQLTLRAELARRSGDIRVLAETAGATVIDAGVKEARISLAVEGDSLRASARWDSARAGDAQAEFSTRIGGAGAADGTPTGNGLGLGGWTWAADSPVSATLRASLPQVGVWSVLAPPGWRMRGTLDAELALTGSRSAPQWTGSVQAKDLALRSLVDGIEFGNGRLRASVQGQRLAIDDFQLQGAGGGAGGEFSARGFAQWLATPQGGDAALNRVRIELDATARALRVSARADRRLAVSGQLQARLVNARLDIQGALTADQALFILPDESAPGLGDDVRVKRSAAQARAPNSAAPAASLRAVATVPGRPTAPAASGVRVPAELALSLDLGPDFRVQGRGINTRLAGVLQLRSSLPASAAPRLSGEVRTVGGSYKAYGQQLAIEQGLLRFGGAYDNPALDILAIRPNLTQRVGVQLTGTALAPRVRLYAEPELAQAEKLAWLVLGRSGANGGAEAAVLQQAALALLGRSGQGISGSLAGALGLDELSFVGASNAAGSAGAATLTLGKRLSKDFYVAFERSLAGTMGSLSVFYELSKRLTLRARTGEQSAIDLIFTLGYD